MCRRGGVASRVVREILRMAGTCKLQRSRDRVSIEPRGWSRAAIAAKVRCPVRRPRASPRTSSSKWKSDCSSRKEVATA